LISEIKRILYYQPCISIFRPSKNNPDIFIEADKQKHNEQISVAAGLVLETMEDLLIGSKTQML